MRYLVTSSEMKEYDNNTITRIGIPALVLMERAALAVREEIFRVMGERISVTGCKDFRVLIAAGSGNNGGDGLALARLLAEAGVEVDVLECGNLSHASESYIKQRDILKFYNVQFAEGMEQIKDAYDFVVDGIFGVGLSRTLGEQYAVVIEKLNGLKGCKVAIDVPSGIDSTTGQVLGCAFQADLTITFGFGKRGLYLYPGAEYAGKVVVAEIGIEKRSFFGYLPEMFTYTEAPEVLMPVRRRDGNKGTFGKVLVIAGWEKMAGAAILCAGSVLKTGAGMVKVFCSEENRGILQCALPEAMYGDRNSLLQDMDWADVIVMGPGLGRSKGALEVLELVLGKKSESGNEEENAKSTARQDKPLVLDADALNLLAGEENLKEVVKYRKGPVIMTPHIGEMSRITGLDVSHIKRNCPEVAKAAGLDYDSIVVCKDARTLVYGKGHPFYLNLTGNCGMATAGSGDVLAGLIGALLAQGQEPFRAACTGVYLHGLAGDEAAREDSEYGVTAAGIVQQIRKVRESTRIVYEMEAGKED